MKLKFLSLFVLSVFTIAKLQAQVTVTSSDSVNCVNPCTTLTAHVVGDVPVNSGISIDDQYPDAPLPIGFTFNFYGIGYTKCLIGPNGTISFDTTLTGAFDDWTISGPLAGDATLYNSVCGPYCDIDIVYGGSITYSTDGVFPNRKFVVTFCATHMYSCTGQYTTTQMILYEGSNNVEVHVAHKTICSSWNGGWAIIGVQNATGTRSTAAPGRDYPSVYTCTDEAWRFTPDDTGTGVFYNVASIGYAPVPYAINPDSIYWYNATTGAYLGVGDTMNVCPSVPTLYKAGKLGCADTSFGSYYIAINPFVTTATPSNPTICGGSDGSITITGLQPGVTDIINYLYNGVPQPPFTSVVSPSGTVTIPGLSSGAYTNIIVSQNACTSAPVSADLVNPPIAVTSVTANNPTVCGLGDGSLTLYGLYGGTNFTITYDFDGTPQPPVVIASNAVGALTIPTLYQGTYTNIVAAISSSPDSCATPPVGPYVLIPPPPPLGFVSDSTHPTQCGYSDGSVTLRAFPPYSTDTINYSFNGTPQPAFVTITNADSTVYLPGLPAGLYSGFTVTIGQCVYTVTGVASLTAPTIKSSFDTIVHLGCHGDTVFFSNYSSAYFYGAPVSPGPLYYIWSFGDGGSDTTANPFHVFATQGVYTVTLVADNHECVDTSSMVISLIHPLFDSFTASTYLVCQDSLITFTNNSFGTAGKPIYYDWYFGDGTTSTLLNTTHDYPVSGTYTVTLVAHDFVPCYDTFSAVVQSDTLSGIQLLATDTVICQGTAITFSSLFSSLGNTGVTWYFGDGDSIKNINPVTYSYDATGAFVVTTTAVYRACQNVTTSRTVNVLPQPILNLGPDTSICEGSGAITLAAVNTVGSPATWLWSTGETTPSISVSTHGLYWATVNVNNCYASDSVIVLNDCYMNIPNVFTPNNDGTNDYFYPRQFLTKGVTSFKMDIFNRWGQLIFETTTLDGAGWDGKLNGVDQPEGVYIYIIDGTFKDGQKEHHQGNITLLR